MLANTLSPGLRWNVVTDLHPSVGLERDYLIVKGILESEGHFVCAYDYHHPNGIAYADRNLFMEKVVPELFSFARENWLFPNPDWFESRWLPCLKDIDKILCKTRDCYRIFSALTPTKCVYVGFTSIDMLDLRIPRLRQFLHVAGKSEFKNTEAVIEAWVRGLPATSLTLVSSIHSVPSGVPNIRIHRWLNDGALRNAMNEHLFHICPSMYEGFGHVIHEAMGCGAVVITTREEPMNELGTPAELSVPVTPGSSFRFNLAMCHIVKWQDVFAAVDRAIASSGVTLAKWQQQARNGYCQGRREFLERFKRLVNSGAVSS